MTYIANTAAYEQPGESITLVPKTSMVDNRYKFVTIGASGMELAVKGGATAPVGVLQTPGIAGEPCKVMTSGVSFVVAEGAIAEGDSLTVGAAGGVTKAALNDPIVGIAVAPCTSGAIGSILLK